MGLIALSERDPQRVEVLSEVVEVRTMMASSGVVMQLRGA
jgi:hypothetical protein